MYHKARTQADIKNQGMYGSLYKAINLQGPGYDDGPSLAPPGASMAQQARAAGYQDIYRDIQADRDAEFQKELKDGQITPEFSGVAGGSVSTQAGVRNSGLYKHLMPRTAPVNHPYLPRTVTSPGRRSGLGAWLGQTAEKSAPGLTIALGILIIYLLFFRKKNEIDQYAAGEEPEVEEETYIEEEVPASRFYY